MDIEPWLPPQSLLKNIPRLYSFGYNTTKMPILNILAHTHREYEMVTGLYLLEPWEKRAVNVTLLSITAATVFSAVHYLPHYTVTLAQYLGLFA